MKKPLNLIIFGMAALSFILFNSCEIGLGASVDTDPPSLEIVNPPVDSIVRGDFAVSGSWTDDGTIAEIKVKLTRTDGKGSPTTSAATVVTDKKGGKGSWSAPLSPSNAGILDGSYEALVEIVDNSGHKTTQSRTFALDNTAPLIVLQRPGTKITETPDAYGQTFSLNGMGADDNSIDHIDINIYSDAECTNLLKTITKSNVPPTIELDVAVFEDGVENDYAAIYGSATKNGAQIRYCTITAYDNAQSYPATGEQTDADKKGNSTTNYYLYDDIYDTVLDHYTITDVYKMLSGTYLLSGTNRSADTVSNVKSLLNQYKIEKSNFSLDPENNPLFFVNGRDPLTGAAADFEGSDYNITTGSSVVVEIATGLDGIPLEASSLRPYLLQCLPGGFSLADGADIPENRIYLAEAGSGAKSGTSYKYTVTFDHTTSYADNKFITIGNAYIIRVEGHDKNGNAIISKGGAYGFKLASNGSAPGLTITNPASTIAYVKANGYQDIEGIVTCQDGYPTITIKKGADAVWSKTFTASEMTEVNGVRQYAFSSRRYFGTQADSSITPDETSNSQIQYTIEASLGDLKTTAYKTVIYDKDAPDITITNDDISPIAKKYDATTDNTVEQTGDFINGRTKIKLTISDGYDSVDTDVNKPYFEVIPADAADDDENAALSVTVTGEGVNSVGNKHYITKLINGNFTIITSSIPDGTNIKFRVHAWDRAGNGKLVKSSALTVDQSSDKPVISPGDGISFSRTNPATDGTVSEWASNNNRKAQIPSGVKLQLNIHDDDGIKDVKVWQKAANTTDNPDNITFIQPTDTTSGDLLHFETIGSSKDINRQIDVASSAGTYWYMIEVRDNVADSERTADGFSSDNGYQKIGPFILKITTAAPTIISVNQEISDASDSSVGKYVSTAASTSENPIKKKWKNRIEIESSENSFELWRQDVTIPAAGTEGLITPVISEASPWHKVQDFTTKTVYDTINIESESITQNTRFYYYIKDQNGTPCTSVKYIDCYVDNIVPTIAINSDLAAKFNQQAINTTSYQFTGTASGTGSEISAIYYKLVSVNSDGTYTTPEWTSTASGWTSVQTQGNWSFYRDNIGSATGIPEGKYKLFMRIFDEAGNMGQAEPVEFHVDKAAPVVTENTSTQYVKKTSSDNGKVSLGGVITESHGIKRLSVTRGSTTYIIVSNGNAQNIPAGVTYSWSYTPTTEASGALTGANWSLNEYPGEGEQTYSIEVEDVTEKTHTITRTVIVDTIPPVYTENSLKVGNAVWSETAYYKDTTLKMSGSFTEAATSGMDTLYYYVQYPGRSGSVPEDLTITDASGNSLADGDVNFKAGDNNFSFTVENYADNTQAGANTLYIQAVDKAGNKSEKTSYTINIDTTAPDLSTLYYKVGTGVLKTAGGTVYVNGSSEIIIYGSYKDEQSGVNPLEFTLAENAISPAPEVTYSTGTPAEGSTTEETAANVAGLSYNPYNSNNKKQYTYWKAVFTPTSGGKFGVKGSNGTYVAGTNIGTASDSPFTITVDNVPPSLNNVRLLIAENTDAFKKTVSSTDRYFIDNTRSTSLTITGVAMDIVGVEKVELSIPGTTTPYTNSGTTSEWKFEGINLSGVAQNANVDAADAVATITVTDVAGNTNSENPTVLNIYFDTTGPFGTHQADALNKDIYFRLGDDENDDITTTSTEPDWSDSLDKDVGKKYSDQTYGNASTIKLRGNISDSDSGVKMIYYHVFDRPIRIDESIEESVTNPTPQTVEEVAYYAFKNNNKLRDYVIAHSTGYFAPLSAAQTRRVFYNVNNTTGLLGGTAFGTSKAYKNVETNYYSSISGFNNSKNYLVVAAEDNVGNKGLDIATVGTGADSEKVYCQINLDVTPPSVNLAATEESTRYSNAETDLIFSGSATDDLAGIKSLIFSVNEHTISTSDADTNYGVLTLDTTSSGHSKTNAAWTLTVKPAALKDNSNQPLTGNVFVYGTVTDYAGDGNSQTVSVATIMMDAQAPVVTLNAPADADTTVEGRQINGTITLSGTARDNKELFEEASETAATMKLYYTTNTGLGTATGTPATTDFETGTVTSTSASSKWVEIATAQHGNTWNFSGINTTHLDGTNAIADNTTVYFMVSAKDKADNTGYSNRVTAIVDQDSDRPVIKFSNLTLAANSAASPISFNTGSLYGAVTDDDGITSLAYKASATDAWQDVSVQNGTFTINLEDGARTVYFKIVDSEGTEFISPATTTYDISAPKLTDSANPAHKFGYRDSTSGSTQTFICLKVDTTDPFAGDLKFATDYVAAAGDTPATATWQENTALSTIILGGIVRNKLRIKLPVWDANGISSVSMRIQGSLETIGFNATTEAPSPVITGYSDAVYWLSDEIDISVLSSGEKNCTITVSDGLRTTSENFTINVDNTAPSVTVNALVDKDTSSDDTQINGTISISGTASDANGLSTESMKLYYTTQASPSVENFTSGNDAATTWKEIKITSHGSSWTFSNINTEELEIENQETTTVHFTVAATDSLGNTNYVTPITAIVDQDTDRPIITLTNLTLTPNSSSSPLSFNTSALYCSVTDDDGISSLSYKTSDSDTWHDVTVLNGTFTANISDGPRSLYFKVVDAGNKTFTSSSADSYDVNTPKLTDTAMTNNVSTPNKFGYRDSVSGKRQTVTYLKIDTTEPFAGSLKFATDYVAATETTPETATWQDKSAISELQYGGTVRPKLRIKIPVWDDNGIASVTMAIPGMDDSINFSPTTEKPNPINATYPDAVYWLSDDIIIHSDNSNIPSGSKACTITVIDGGNKDTKETVSFTVDNTAPTSISNVKPSKLEAVSGTVNYRGSVSDNEGGSGILLTKDDDGNVTNYGVKFYIPKYSERNNEASTIPDASWESPTTPGTVSWEIEFTNLGPRIGYNSSTYAVGDDYSGYETESGSGLYDIPVWFRLTDAVNNVGYVTTNSIRYNPNEDRPTAQITYPTHETGHNYVIMGGTINISGIANDDDGISKVYLQFDMDGDGTFENGEGVTGNPFEASEIVEIPYFVVDGVNQKGVVASGTKSWYKTVNISQLNGVNFLEDDGKTLNVRVLAVEKDSDKADADLLRSAWSDVLHISVNNKIPQLSGYKLKKYTTAPANETLESLTPAAEKDYTANMYINGNDTGWYFCGQFQSSTVTLNSISVSGSTTSVVSYKSDDGKTEYFAIPISVSTGTWHTVIQATDNTAGNPQHSNPFDVYINVDSAAPTFTDTKEVGPEDNIHTEIKLYKSQYGTSANELSSSTYIQDSNGWFTLTGRVTEEISGYNKIVFYFKRKASASDLESDRLDRVYNPMEVHGTDNTANRTNITATPAAGTAKTSGSLYINDDNLPGLYISGATRSEENSITSATIKNNKNIRTGGLIKIGGTYRLITDVSSRDSDGKISFTPNCSITYTEAEFIYGMVVDHSGESQNADGTVKNDDEYPDGMVESFAKSGSNYTWDATINSKNIPDGPIEVHCVAFDNAGNIRHGYTTTKVSNNPPRITKVQLGTDLNADGIYAIDKEFAEFYYSKQNQDTTVGTEIWNLDAKVNSETWWQAKKNVVVIPEFVGGSGTIYYNYSKSTGDSQIGLTTFATGSTGTNPPTLAALSTSAETIKATATDGTDATITASETNNKIGVLILENDSNSDGLGKISTSTGDDDVNTYRFCFWDSTEGCTPGSDTQWSVLNVKFYQDLADNTPPVGRVTPFHWTSSTDNSVMWNGTSALGHIELEEDLPTAIFNVANTTSSGLYDNDPKVSGKIKVEGTAFDETRIASISVTMGNKTAEATYDNGWTNDTDDSDFSLTVSDSTGPTQSGHSVTWTLHVDTSTVVTNNITATDKALTVTVTDAASNSDSGASTQTTSESPTRYYKMDIVPYITEVTRVTTKGNTNRARSGAVSLLRGETTKITGFNLNGGTTTGNSPSTTVKVAPNKNGSGTVVSMEDVTISGSDLTFTVPAAAKSGYLHVLVNGVAALNNMNGYKVYNTETNAKAFDHNTLTDDRYVHVWRVSQEDTFFGSKNAKYPAMSSASDGTLYASFTNYGQSKTYYTNKFIGTNEVSYSSETGATNDITTVFFGYDPPEETDISVGPDGKVNVFYNANYHGGSAEYWGDGSYYYSWNNTEPTRAGGIYSYDEEATDTSYNTNSRIPHRFYRFELYTYDNELNQFTNLRVKRTYDTENTTSYVNVAYYDRLTGAIKYSYVKNKDEVTYSEDSTSYTFTYTTTGTYAGYYATSSDIRYSTGYVKIGDNYYNMSYYNRYRPDRNSPWTYYCSFEGYTESNSTVESALYTRNVNSVRDTSSYGLPWVVIDGDSDVTDTDSLVPDHKTGTDNTFSFAGGWTPKVLSDARYSGVSRTTGTGESLSLTSNPNGYPVIFYMDASTGQPRIAYANSRTPNAVTNWTVQGVFASSDENYNTVSDYMSCVVDNQGYLHIAFQNTKGQLVYAKSTNNPSNGTTAYTFGTSQVLDDSGMHIDMTMNGTNGTTPYISYLSRVNSYDGMKIAFYDSTFDENNDGIADGGWETITAAMDAKVTNVRTCIEPNAKAYDGNSYTAAIGYHPGSDYRAAFYVGQ